jgi:hypothetical protein
MNVAMTRFDRIVIWLRLTEPIMLELCQTLAMAWVSIRLLSPPSNYEAYVAGFRFLATLGLTEWVLGCLTATCSLLSFLGFILSAFAKVMDIGPLLRCLALSIAGFFWTTLGASFLTGNIDSLSSVPLMIFGILAWWTILRSPAAVADHCR